MSGLFYFWISACCCVIWSSVDPTGLLESDGWPKPRAVLDLNVQGWVQGKPRILGQWTGDEVGRDFKLNALRAHV